MSDLICAGDKVSIQFSTHPPIVGKVTWCPMATSDCWHITSKHGDVYYVQQYDYMLKLSEPSID